jgi:hypothetical protein
MKQNRNNPKYNRDTARMNRNNNKFKKFPQTKPKPKPQSKPKSNTENSEPVFTDLKTLNTYIGPKGYTILKSELSEAHVAQIKQILMEGKSEMCSSSENEFYGQLYDTNEKVKSKYKEGINKILYDVFSDNWVLNPGEIYIPGYYDLESPGRSLINNLNTNFSTFCVLVNDINRVIKQIPNASPINFKNKKI